MRKKVEYYNGYNINRRVIHRINLIDLKRIKEGITEFTMEKIKNLKSLCEIHDTTPEQEHIILGEDWYINYTDISEDEIEINEWVAINNVENKLTQTMEMYTALKKILLKHAQKDIYAMLRHSTSYKFYQKFLSAGYIEESLDILDFDDSSPELEKIKYKILTEYDSFEEYLSDENRERYESESVEDFIYHEVSFNVTEEFKHRYKKTGR